MKSRLCQSICWLEFLLIDDAVIFCIFVFRICNPYFLSNSDFILNTFTAHAHLIWPLICQPTALAIISCSVGEGVQKKIHAKFAHIWKVKLIRTILFERTRWRPIQHLRWSDFICWWYSRLQFLWFRQMPTYLFMNAEAVRYVCYLSFDRHRRAIVKRCFYISAANGGISWFAGSVRCIIPSEWYACASR